MYALFFLAAVALAAGKDADPARLLASLTAANEAKDAAQIQSLLGTIAETGKARGDQEALDALARELSISLHICRKKWDTLEQIVDTLGELRSKQAKNALKRLAFHKKTREGRPRSLQVHALSALGKLVDPRLLGGFEDMAKGHSVPIAKAAYRALENYESAKGRVRHNVAELLIKRIAAESPPGYSGRSTKYVSPETYARWRAVSRSITNSLQAICHQPTIEAAQDWQEWWKENKANRKVWRNEP